MHPTRRKVPLQIVAQAHQDYLLRRNAEQMIALGKDILRKTPTMVDHAKVAGVNVSSISQAVHGISYKELF